MSKGEHFLDFIFSSGLLQDVAYGTTQITYDDGTKQRIAHSVLTAKYSHAVSFYVKTCQEIGYTPLSQSSLMRILEAIKPSQRRSLSGLDHIPVTAAAMTGFDVLLDMCKKDVQKELVDELIRSKRYLKLQFQSQHL